MHGTRAQGVSARAAGCASRLGHEVALEIDEREKLEGIDLDGKPCEFPPGAPPNPSDVLSDELEIFVPQPGLRAGRDRGRGYRLAPRRSDPLSLTPVRHVSDTRKAYEFVKEVQLRARDTSRGV